VEPITKKPNRRSKAEREELVAKWRASGQSVYQFAAEHGLANSSLYQWVQAGKRRAQAKKKTGSRKRGPSSKAAFAEVSVVGQTPARPQAMTVTLRGGHSVTFEGATVDLAWLESVLKVVSAC
jgi:transposase-like protein